MAKKILILGALLCCDCRVDCVRDSDCGGAAGRCSGFPMYSCLSASDMSDMQQTSKSCSQLGPSIVNGNSDDASSGFGQVVALDQDLLLVGHPGAAGSSPGGQTYAFTASTGKFLGSLTPRPMASQDDFGSAVAVRSGVAVAGASQVNNQAGAAFIYSCAQSGCTAGQLLPMTAMNNSHAGAAVATDGALVGVSAPDSLGSKQGSIFVFDRSGAPVGDSVPGTIARAGFGSSLAVSDLWAVTGDTQGNLWLLSRPSATAGFVSMSTLGPVSDAAVTSSHQLYTVAMSGERLVVGDKGATVNGKASGAAFFSALSGGSWSPLQRLPIDVDGVTGIGTSVALSGTLAVVGTGTGQSWAISLSGSQVAATDIVELRPQDTLPAGSAFGNSVAASGTSVAVAATGADRGRVYIFDCTGF